MKIDVCVLSCDRYEMLALCLAGLCGHNGGVGGIRVIDDASEDPRVHELLRRYREACLIERVAVTPRRSGVGVTRRMAVDGFLAGDAELLVQVEGDVLVGPGELGRFAAAWQDLRDGGFPAHWLCAHAYDWCHRRLARLAPPAARGGVVELWEAQGESFWLASRAGLTRHGRHITRERPDLVAFHRAAGCASLAAPEIAAQHMGCIGQSFYYPPEQYTWATWDRLCYRNADSTVRQPYPELFTIDFETARRDWRGAYARWAAQVAGAARVRLPEAP
jgi:hypothetical protein